MGTLGGFPNPPALWLRRAKPGYAYAIMGTLGGFASPSAPADPPYLPLAALGLAKPSRDAPLPAELAGCARVRIASAVNGNPTCVPTSFR